MVLKNVCSYSDQRLHFGNNSLKSKKITMAEIYTNAYRFRFDYEGNYFFYYLRRLTEYIDNQNFFQISIVLHRHYFSLVVSDEFVCSMHIQK